MKVKSIVSLFILFLFIFGCGEDNSKSTDITPPQNLIGSEGGVVSSTDNSAILTIPAGALSDPTEITLNITTNHPSGNIGLVYDFGPDGLEFNSSVTLSLEYMESDLGNVDESDLSLAVVNGNDWSILNSNVDMDNNIVSASINHFSKFGIVDKSKNCQVILTEFRDIAPGDTISYQFLADNGGKVNKVMLEDSAIFEITFNYDASGKITSANSEYDASFNFTYTNDLITTAIDDDQTEYTITYNSLKQIELIEYENEEREYEYDSNGNLISDTENGNETEVYTYDNKNNPLKTLGLPDIIFYLLLDFDPATAYSTNNVLTEVDFSGEEGTYSYTYNNDDFPISANFIEELSGTITSQLDLQYDYDCK
ncbi:hypothetical protein HZR84_10430 [Hyphobacterium sp. CCMP332]|nr:hypothetical protein HZR84_10430 [Hyphobacterium sp. CCMP332]